MSEPAHGPLLSQSAVLHANVRARKPTGFAEFQAAMRELFRSGYARAISSLDVGQLIADELVRGAAGEKGGVAMLAAEGQGDWPLEGLGKLGREQRESVAGEVLEAVLPRLVQALADVFEREGSSEGVGPLRGAREGGAGTVESVGGGGRAEGGGDTLVRMGESDGVEVGHASAEEGKGGAEGGIGLGSVKGRQQRVAIQTKMDAAKQAVQVRSFPTVIERSFAEVIRCFLTLISNHACLSIPLSSAARRSSPLSRLPLLLPHFHVQRFLSAFSCPSSESRCAHARQLVKRSHKLTVS